MVGSPATQSSAPKDGDRTALVALLGFMAIFLAVLVTGWHRLLLPSVARDVEFVAWALALGVGCVAIVMAKMVAKDRLAIAQAKRAGEPAPASTWWAYFIVLFVLSALGTLNMVFYYGEGKTVITENIDQARDCLGRVQAAAESIVASPKFEAKTARVNGYLTQLEAEIRNPSSCGEGPAARRIIADLKSELPRFDISQGARTCKEGEAMIPAYRDLADKLLRDSPEFVAENVAKKEDFSRTLKEMISVERNRLATAKANLDTLTIEEAKKTLESTWIAYTELSTRAGQLDGKETRITCGIRMDQIRGIGSLSQILPLILSRLDRISTYVYILASVLGDILLVVFFMNVMRGTRGGGGDLKKPKTGGPKYIWSNP